MAVPLLAIGIPMAMNVARVIGQQGLKEAIKRYGPQAAKMVNKNMNKLRKRFPEILGPQKKANRPRTPIFHRSPGANSCSKIPCPGIILRCNNSTSQVYGHERQRGASGKAGKM